MSPWRMERGACPGPEGTVRFSVWAPRARRVDVRLCGEGGRVDQSLEGREGGIFESVVPWRGAPMDYWFRLDGERDRPDPTSRYQPAGVHGPSRVVDPSAFRWTDAGWQGVETRDLVFYELHVGTFTQAGTFEALIDHLPALRDLGITAVELMPVAEFPGGRNWGYDGVDLYAPHSTYGGPEGLARLVDACHVRGLALFLDVVYNHLGPEGNYLAEFGPYFTDRTLTPWGPAINYDGPDSDEVRRFVVDNALSWITDYHVDGLRLDAVHGIFDRSARHILDEIAEAVHAQAERLGRRIQVIAESDLNDPRLVRPHGCGGYGLDAIWNDDFHHAIHTALTGERDGYYTDFGGTGPVAKALQERFVLDGAHSAYRRRRHGAPAGDVPPDRFVVFAQNHDQVGNRARGDRLSTLVPFEAQKLSAALVLLSPYVPLLFMGEEYGEINPFLYFVSHGDPALVEAVRRGRAQDFRSFRWSGKVPDPQDEATFVRSRLDRSLARKPGHTELLTLHRDLLHLRREEPSLRPGNARVKVECDARAEWIALALSPGEAPDLLALFNLKFPVARGKFRRDLKRLDQHGDAWFCLRADGVDQLERAPL